MPRSLRVPGAHGLTLHALAWSDDGVPMVFLHGFGHEAHVWDDACPVVAPYYRTVAFDLRGHGDSDRDPEGRYDYDAHVADLESALAALGIDRLVLVGHSLGGRIATLFAAAHPGRMAGLVLVDTGPELDRRGTVRITLDAGGSGPRDFASPEEYAGVLARAYPAAPPAVITRMARHGLRRREDGRYEPRLDPRYRSGLRGIDAATLRAREEATTQRLWAALGRIPCPTLVVRGAASDVLAADVADRMVEEALPDARLAVVPQAGHSVAQDNPQGFVAALSGFVLGDA